mmetsp:Transcript_55221/g.112966  ORF Transcript_55221/g.112966 Transcript_55221/m.112966 type:complete len:252 (-) Transcript_55221:668-1423(-)
MPCPGIGSASSSNAGISSKTSSSSGSGRGGVTGMEGGMLMGSPWRRSCCCFCLSGEGVGEAEGTSGSEKRRNCLRLSSARIFRFVSSSGLVGNTGISIPPEAGGEAAASCSTTAVGGGMESAFSIAVGGGTMRAGASGGGALRAGRGGAASAGAGGPPFALRATGAGAMRRMPAAAGTMMVTGSNMSTFAPRTSSSCLSSSTQQACPNTPAGLHCTTKLLASGPSKSVRTSFTVSPFTSGTCGLKEMVMCS